MVVSFIVRNRTSLSIIDIRFRPHVPSWRVTLNNAHIRVAYAWPSRENMTSSTTTKTNSKWLIALPSDKNRDTVTRSNVHRKSDEVWTCGFWDMRTDRQTDRQTDRHTYRNVDRALPYMHSNSQLN